MATCLVTIHGVGFQTAGYADKLHAQLQLELGAALAPLPLYISGHWPPHDEELSKLGRWDSTSHRTIVTTEAPFGPAGTIVHIPLVYSDTEGNRPNPGAALEVAAQAALALGNLNVLQDLARMGADFVDAAVKEAHAAAGAALQAIEGRLADALHRTGHLFVQAPAPATSTPTVQQRALLAKLDPNNLLSALENDMAMYVVRNGHRERVRSFVHEVILRLCFRNDVEAVVINAHSNGSVISTDVLRQLPPAASTQVRWLVTSGSPLRKYNDFFGWGTEFFLSNTAPQPGQVAEGLVPQIANWTNFWDRRDPVADPINGRFAAFDPQTGNSQPVRIADIVVDNIANSGGGGMQAHNHWDNSTEWIPQMVEILQDVVAAPANPQPRAA